MTAVGPHTYTVKKAPFPVYHSRTEFCPDRTFVCYRQKQKQECPFWEKTDFSSINWVTSFFTEVTNYVDSLC